MGTLKNQIPKLLKKSLFWLSCTCLQCFWLEKNNWPSYCTSNKFSVPPSKNFNVPTRQIFNTSDYNIDDFDLYDKKPVMQHICITQRHIVLHKYIFWGILDFLQFHWMVVSVTWGHCTKKGFLIRLNFKIYIFSLWTTSIVFYIVFEAVGSLKYLFEGAK